MIRLHGRLRCMTDAERAAVLAHIGEHTRLTRAEPACLSFDFTKSDDPLTFVAMEAFRDRAGFDAYQARTRQSAWFDATRDILRDFRVEKVGD